MSDQEAAEWHVSPVHLGKRVDLADYDPDEKGGLRKSEAKMRLQAN